MLRYLIMGIVCAAMLCGCKADVSPKEELNPEQTPQEEEPASEEIINEGDEPQEDLMSEYKLVWSDEFDYEGKPDPTKWNYDIGGHGWGNNESQYYTDEEANAYVKDGSLFIKAIKEEKEGKNYTSARLTTFERQSWKYGKFEIKAKLPKGKGTWPAIWMLPDDIRSETPTPWPLCGEIDIMEHVGKDENMVHVSLHTSLYNHIKGTQRTYFERLTDVFDTAHEYSFEWTPEYIEFFYDGRAVKRFTKGVDGSDIGVGGWPFDKPFYLILNIAVGGNWGGEIDDAMLPYLMEIEYVRVYQKD